MVFLQGCTHYPTWIPIHVQLQSFVLNLHHKHQWFSQHYVFHVISLQPCGWVSAWDPFNSICENQFIPMSYVWLYCIDILTSGNCRWLSIERYHTPTSPQIQYTISCTSSPKNSLLVSSEVYPQFLWRFGPRPILRFVYYTNQSFVTSALISVVYVASHREYNLETWNHEDVIRNNVW